MDDFPHYLPTQNWRVLEFWAKFLEFFDEILEIFVEILEFFLKILEFSQKTLRFITRVAFLSGTLSFILVF